MDQATFQNLVLARLDRLDAANKLPPLDASVPVYSNGMTRPSADPLHLGRVRSERYDTVIWPKVGADIAARMAAEDAGPNRQVNDLGEVLHLSSPGPFFYLRPALATFAGTLSDDEIGRIQVNCGAATLPVVGWEGFAWYYKDGPYGNKGTMLPGTTSFSESNMDDFHAHLDQAVAAYLGQAPDAGLPWVAGEKGKKA